MTTGKTIALTIGTFVGKLMSLLSVVLSRFVIAGGRNSKPLHLKGHQPRIFTGGTNAETEAPILWPPDVKN